MKYDQLLRKSEAYFIKYAANSSIGISSKVFSAGAFWMWERITEIDNNDKLRSIGRSEFTIYGVFKYGLCSLAFVVSFWLFFRLSVFLTPLSVLGFYIVEVHFLFLFPLVLDRAKYPILKSIKISYRMGIWRLVINVIPIGLYMIFGIFNKRNSLRNWHIGCLAIIIWYIEEVRNRL